MSQALTDSFAPVFADIRERATVADRFLDRDLYRVYVSTLWANVVLSPDEVATTRRPSRPTSTI